jgi:transcriptional regulator with XRE-family HTH domain
MTVAVSELCERDKLTIPQLAEQSGLAPDRVTAIVLGRWTPSPEERNKIAKVFGVEKEDIAWGHKTPIQHIYGSGPG